MKPITPLRPFSSLTFVDLWVSFFSKNVSSTHFLSLHDVVNFLSFSFSPPTPNVPITPSTSLPPTLAQPVLSLYLLKPLHTKLTPPKMFLSLPLSSQSGYVHTYHTSTLLLIRDLKYSHISLPLHSHIYIYAVALLPSLSL